MLAAVTAVYAVVLPAGFIEFDDRWLIVESPFLRDASPAALWRAWTALDPRTRLVLGAEYLPIRDTVAWCLARVASPSPALFHAAQLGVYLAAVALVRSWLRRVWTDPWRAELAAWLFALHPAHVPSVAWAAGLKDALSLLFMAAALRAYARDGRRHAVTVAALTALACLSKGTSVALPALLLAGDLLAARRPRGRAVAASALVAVASVALQARVGASVHMFAEPLGRNVFERVASMAPVLWRYLAVSSLLEAPCMVRVVPARAALDPVALASLAAIAGMTVAAARRLRAGDRVPAAALALFVAGLAPVSQVFAPLQNRMADRYLLVAALGPCVLAADVIARAPRPALRGLLAGAVTLLAAALSARHAWEFADADRLWRDALTRAPESALAPYQLALTEESRGRYAEAVVLYRESLRRDALRSDLSPRAVTNLSRLLAVSGRADEAESLLRGVIARFPAHPRPINNLATLRFARGDRDEARALFLRLVRDFPEYPRGRAGFVARFGELPGPSAPARPEDPWRIDLHAR